MQAKEEERVKKMELKLRKTEVHSPRNLRNYTKDSFQKSSKESSWNIRG